MYHPYVRQKLVETRAHELERIAEDDRAAQAGRERERDAPRFRLPIRISLSVQITVHRS
jgi:hypothetical protein